MPGTGCCPTPRHAQVRDLPTRTADARARSIVLQEPVATPALSVLLSKWSNLHATWVTLSPDERAIW